METPTSLTLLTVLREDILVLYMLIIYLDYIREIFKKKVP